jgi:hypothetical protein
VAFFFPALFFSAAVHRVCFFTALHPLTHSPEVGVKRWYADHTMSARFTNQRAEWAAQRCSRWCGRASQRHKKAGEETKGEDERPRRRKQRTRHNAGTSNTTRYRTRGERKHKKENHQTRPADGPVKLRVHHWRADACSTRRGKRQDFACCAAFAAIWMEMAVVGWSDFQERAMQVRRRHSNEPGTSQEQKNETANQSAPLSAWWALGGKHF